MAADGIEAEVNDFGDEEFAEAQEKFEDDLKDIVESCDTTPLWRLIEQHTDYIMCRDNSMVVPEAICGSTTTQMKNLIHESGVYEIPGLGSLLRKITDWLFNRPSGSIIRAIFKMIWCGIVLAISAIAFGIRKAYRWSREQLDSFFAKKELPAVA